MRLYYSAFRLKNCNAFLKRGAECAFIIRDEGHPPDSSAVSQKNVIWLQPCPPVCVHEIGLSDLACIVVAHSAVKDILCAQEVEARLRLVFAVTMFSVGNLLTNFIQLYRWPRVFHIVWTFLQEPGW